MTGNRGRFRPEPIPAAIPASERGHFEGAPEPGRPWPVPAVAVRGRRPGQAALGPADPSATFAACACSWLTSRGADGL